MAEHEASQAVRRTTLIVRGRWVLQDADTVLDDGAVVVEGDQIAEVGAWRDVRQRYPQAPVMGSEQYAVIPGLINAHHHSNGVTALQQGIADRLLEPWLLSLARRRGADTYLSTLLSAARLLRTGVTAVVDVHNGRGSPTAYKATVQDALRAYDKAGMRVAFATGMTEQNFLVWDSDERFLSSLPPEARAMAEMRLPSPDNLTPDDYFAVFDELWQRYEAHPRIDLWFGPPGPQWVSDDFMQRIAARAEALGTGIQTHLLESYYERQHGRRVYGRPTVLHLRDLGVLSPRLSFAHGVWLTEEEIAIIGAAGAHVSHNPSSNLRLRAGIAPLNAMLGAGLNNSEAGQGSAVGLGMDGTTLNDDEDMFTEMRLALNLHRTPKLSMAAPAASDIWRMATTGGARLMQAGSRLGRLAQGYAADLVLLRLERLLWPWSAVTQTAFKTAPEADAAVLLLSRATARDVDTVLVAGDVALQEGKPRNVDVAEAGAALAEMLAGTPFPDKAAEMVQVLLPHLEAYYRQWEEEGLEPYTTYNSRT